MAALKEAEAAGVKIVYVDSPANHPAVKTFATDNVAAGKTAGEEMLKALNEKGITEGKIGIINTNAATTSTVDRENGFRSAFEGTNFEIGETQYSEGDAAKSKDIATNYIAQGCVGIFGTNEGCTVGTGNAIKEDGGDVIGVGFDKSDMIQSLIKDGSLLCTMAQNPDVMGYEGIKAAVAALDGRHGRYRPECGCAGVKNRIQYSQLKIGPRRNIPPRAFQYVLNVGRRADARCAAAHLQDGI